MMKMNVVKQHPEKRNIVPWNSSDSIRSGNSFTNTNESTHKSATQNEIPKSFIFSGITSDMTKYGSVKTAHDAMNMTHEKLISGTQLYGSTLNFQNFSNEYEPKVIKPRAVPTVDTENRN